MQIRSLCAAVWIVLLLSPWEPVASAAASSSSQLNARRYDSIFILGDSFTDTGNNPAVFAWYSMASPTTHPPYGTTFFGRPTGRNCDGRLIIDFIAEGLGLPDVPPYLGPPFASPPPPAKSGKFRQGASLSVGGATALDAAFYHSRGILPPPNKFPLNTSLGVQLGWFESRLKHSLCRTTQECDKFFGRSIFFVGEFGVNDYQFSFGKMKIPDIISGVVPSIIDTIRQAVERLIVTHGAKTVVVPGVIPLGCSPMVLGMFPDPDRAGYDAKTGCMLKHNELGRQHNTLLQASLQQIRAKHPGVRIIYADFFSPVMEMVESPRKFGFREDVLSSCCGGPGKRNHSVIVPCGDPDAATCTRPSAALYWDGVHFTEAANRRIATSWMNSISSDARAS